MSLKYNMPSTLFYGCFAVAGGIGGRNSLLPSALYSLLTP